MELPAWAATYKLILIVQPSSAAAERVFSLLQNSFSTKQNTSIFVHQLCYSAIANNYEFRGGIIGSFYKHREIE